MDRLNDDDGKSIVKANFNGSVLEAFIIEIKINSRKECEVWGKYGTTAMPDEDNFDIYIKTKGYGKIKKKIPRLLSVDFLDSYLRITVMNERYSENLPIDPLTAVLRCEGKIFVGYFKYLI